MKGLEKQAACHSVPPGELQAHAKSDVCVVAETGAPNGGICAQETDIGAGEGL